MTLAANATNVQSYQWRKNDVSIAGATASTLTLADLQLADAGSYSLVATNAAGSTASEPAVLTIRAAPIAPAILKSPSGQVMSVGATVVLVAAISGAPTPTLQWQRNGLAIAGATDAMLVLTNVQAADAGSYAVVATNAAGAVTSAAALLEVAIEPGSTLSRLVNLSVRTAGGTGDRTLILGVTLGGAGAVGARPVLVRGIGPSLAAFGLAGFLPEPALTVFRGASVVAANGSWAGDADVALAATRVGAFPLASATSKDAALLGQFESGGYSIQIAPSARAGVAAEPGLALAELYDITPLESAVG